MRRYMSDDELREIILKSLRDRVTPISSAAILTGVPYGNTYERGRELIWEFVQKGILIRKKLNSYSKIGKGFINVYKMK